MSRVLSGGKQSMKSADKKKSRSSLFIVDNIKWRTFYFKDDYGKLWVEVIIVSFLDAVVTTDVLTASNNDLT